MENYFKTNYQHLENGNVVDNIPYYVEEDSFVPNGELLTLLNELIVRSYGVSYPNANAKINYGERSHNNDRCKEIREKIISFEQQGTITVDIYGHTLVVEIDNSKEYLIEKVKLTWTKKINLDVLEW